MLLAAQVCYVVRGGGTPMSAEEILARWSTLGWWPGLLPTLDEVRAGMTTAVLERRLAWTPAVGDEPVRVEPTGREPRYG